MIRDFEFVLNSNVSNEILIQEYRKMEEYMSILPCGCADAKSNNDDLGISCVIHGTLVEILSFSKPNLRMNSLDEKRRKKVLHNLESLKSWISKDVDFDESKRYEIVKELNKIARALRQLAFDVN